MENEKMNQSEEAMWARMGFRNKWALESSLGKARTRKRAPLELENRDESRIAELCDAEMKIKGLMQERDYLREELSRSIEQNKLMELEMTQIRQVSYGESDQSVEELEMKIKILLNEVSELEGKTKECLLLEQKVRKLENELRNSKDSVELLENALQKCQIEKEEAMASLKSLNVQQNNGERTPSFKGERREVENVIREKAYQEIFRCNQRADQLQAEVKRLQLVETRNKSTFEEQEKLISELKYEALIMRQRAEDLQMKLAHCEISLSNMGSRCFEAEELQESNQKMRETIIIMENQFREIEQEKSRVKELETKLTLLSRETEGLRERLLEKSKENELLKCKIGSLEAFLDENEGINDKVKTMQKELESIREERDNMRLQMISKTTGEFAIINEVQGLNGLLNQKNEEIEKWSKRAEELQRKSMDWGNEKKDWESKLKQSEEDRGQWAAMGQELIKEIQKKAEEIEIWKGRCMEVERELKRIRKDAEEKEQEESKMVLEWTLKINEIESRNRILLNENEMLRKTKEERNSREDQGTGELQRKLEESNNQKRKLQEALKAVLKKQEIAMIGQAKRKNGNFPAEWANEENWNEHPNGKLQTYEQKRENENSDKLANQEETKRLQRENGMLKEALRQKLKDIEKLRAKLSEISHVSAQQHDKLRLVELEGRLKSTMEEKEYLLSQVMRLQEEIKRRPASDENKTRSSTSKGTAQWIITSSDPVEKVTQRKVPTKTNEFLSHSPGEQPNRGENGRETRMSSKEREMMLTLSPESIKKNFRKVPLGPAVSSFQVNQRTPEAESQKKEVVERESPMKPQGNSSVSKEQGRIWKAEVEKLNKMLMEVNKENDILKVKLAQKGTNEENERPVRMGHRESGFNIFDSK